MSEKFNKALFVIFGAVIHFAVLVLTVMLIVQFLRAGGCHG